MKKVIVIKNGVQAFGAQFADDAVMQDWIAECEANNSWGLPERPELGLQGEPTGVTLPAEYTVEIVDLETDPEYIKAKFVAKKEKNAQFGQSLIRDLQWRNSQLIRAGTMTMADAMQMAHELEAIEAWLVKGEIEIAAELITNAQLSSVITQELKDQFLGKIGDYFQ